MLKRLKILRWLGWLYTPVQQNGTFILVITLLAWLLTGHNYLLWVYLAAGIITLIPPRYRTWIKTLLYAAAYATVLAAVVCHAPVSSQLPSLVRDRLLSISQSGTSEILSQLAGWDIIHSTSGKVVTLLMLHLLWNLLRYASHSLTGRIILPKVNKPIARVSKALMGVLTLFAICSNPFTLLSPTPRDKTAQMADSRLTSKAERAIKNSEHTSENTTEAVKDSLETEENTPEDTEENTLEATEENTPEIELVIDSCIFRVPHLVLAMSDGYNKGRSQLYNQPLSTTPRQHRLMEEGTLVRYDHATASAPITNYISRHSHLDQLFAKAGYHVQTINAAAPSDSTTTLMASLLKAKRRHQFTLIHLNGAATDASLRQNDSILYAAIRSLYGRDAVMVYMAGKGDNTALWLWCSPKYIKDHPYGWLAVNNARSKRVPLSALPHLLMYLGGIYTPLYDERLNMLLPSYQPGL